jgi:hypothetical protein
LGSGQVRRFVNAASVADTHCGLLPTPIDASMQRYLMIAASILGRDFL